MRTRTLALFSLLVVTALAALLIVPCGTPPGRRAADAGGPAPGAGSKGARAEPLPSADAAAVAAGASEEEPSARESLEAREPGSAGAWVVEGRAYRGTEEPLPAARIRARLFEGMQREGTPREEAVLVADREGRFRWPLPAPEGTVTVVVDRAPDEEGVVPAASSFGDAASVTPGEAPPKGLAVYVFPFDRHASGAVTDADGVPLEGARVRGSARVVTTDGDGRYRIETSSARAKEFLYAEADGYVQVRAPVTASEDAASDSRVDFHLARAVQARGRVVDEEGRPVEGASVATFFTHENVATSDAEGRFVLDHLDPRRDRHTVYARKDGYVQATANPTADELRAGELELVLPRGVRVEGVVVDPAGEPVANASLFIGFSQFAYDRLDATSDAEGAFVFPHVGAGEQKLFARRHGFAPATTVLRIAEDATSLPAVTVRMEPGHFLAGDVTDGAGTPLEGVWVHARQRDEYVGERVTTDASGRFRVEDLPGEGLALELYSQHTVRLELPIEEPDRDDVHAVLQRAGGIAGTVVDDASGGPLDAFTVRFVDPVLGPEDARVTGFSATWSREGHRFSGTHGTWTTEGEELAPGAVIGIEVRADGYAPETVDRVAVADDPDPSALVVRMRPGGAVEGRVVDADGAPVPDCEVRVRGAAASFGRTYQVQFESGITHTDAVGSFRLENVAPGERVLWVTAPGQAAWRDEPFDLAAGATVDRVVVLPRGGRIEGRVLSTDGTPVGGTGVVVRSTYDPDVPGSGRTSREATTDAAGAFAVDDLPAGDYQVSRLLERGDLSAWDLTTPCTVRVGQTTRVTLQAAGTATIRGHLEGEVEGLPPSLRVTLVLRPDPGAAAAGSGATSAPPVPRTTLSADGAFEVTGVMPGRYTVVVIHTTPELRVAGSAEVIVADGETAEVVVPLQRR